MNHVGVRSLARPSRYAGLSVLPPFFAIPYDSQEVLVSPGLPSNLRNPVVAWFAEHAVVLKGEYPALFVQMRRALATVSTSIAPWQRTEAYTRHMAEESAALLNVLLERIRRAVPGSAAALTSAVDVDVDGRLITRI